MHVDEAVHAIKFGSLLEDGSYRYDPVEYHGPSLNYLTLIPAWLSGKKSITEIDEALLRCVPAFSGILLIVSFLFLYKDFGWRFVLAVSIATSLSSFIVFYNRYYIQESLLVAFFYAGIISFYRYVKSQRIIPLIIAAVLLALSYASKETFVIPFAAAALSFIVMRLNDRSFRINKAHSAIFIAVFSTAAVLLFSSFFANPHGIIDSLKSFANYFSKADAFPGHHHPWYYYFSVVTFATIEGFIYSEALMLVLFAAGVYYLLIDKQPTTDQKTFLRVIALLTIATMIIYSVIPYKTPWTMFTFWQGMLIIASYAAVKIYDSMNRKVFYAVSIIFCLQLAFQTWHTTFTYSFHPANPFVYSQSTNDVVEISKMIKNVSASQEEKGNMSLYVAASGNDYWPLPWYLRGFKNVSWNEKIKDDVYRYDVVLASPEYESALGEALYRLPPPGEANLYVPLFGSYMELRPGTEIRGYIRKSVLDRYINSKTVPGGETR